MIPKISGKKDKGFVRKHITLMTIFSKAQVEDL